MEREEKKLKSGKTQHTPPQPYGQGHHQEQSVLLIVHACDRCDESGTLLLRSSSPNPQSQPDMTKTPEKSKFRDILQNT